MARAKGYQLVPVAHIRAGQGVRLAPVEPGEQAVSLDRLAVTMAAHGLLTPLRVRQLGPEDYICDIGQRRLEAARLAGLTDVPCLVRDGEVSEAAILEEQAVEQLCREDLTPMEVSRLYDRLRQINGWSQRDIADHVGVDVSTVCRALQRLELPPEVQEMVEQGGVPATTALSILSMPSEEQVTAAQAIQDERKPRRKVLAEAPLKRKRFTFQTPKKWELRLFAPSGKREPKEPVAIAELENFLVKYRERLEKEAADRAAKEAAAAAAEDESQRQAA